MTAILKQFQATLSPASVKAIEEICVACGGAHPYYQCLAADGNTFPKLLDNIQGYVAAAAVNYNQGSSFFQINTASTLGSGSNPSNTIANPKGELKAITTRSGNVFDGPFVPIPPPFINLEEDERVEETLRDQDLAEYTIKVPPPLVQNPKPPSQINFDVHQRDPLHPNIPYPSRMYKQKQQEKNEVQIHKFWQMFKQLHINITFADGLILIPKYQKMLKALLSNKEKLLELVNTPLDENCSAVILKKLLENLEDPRKFLILCGFSELNCKALADLGASINLMPLFFTFPTDFVIADYESDPRVLLILGIPFLWTARALIDVYEEEMILRDGDERLTLNMRHDTSSYSNHPQKESINMINIYDDSSEYFLENLFSTNHQSGNPTFSSHPNLTSPEVKDDVFDPEGANEFADELALITFPPRNDDLPFDIESDHKEIEYLLNNDPIMDMDSILEDSINQTNLANLNDNLVDTMLEMFIEEHALDYSSPPLYDEYDDDLFEVDNFLPSSKYDSFLSEDFSKIDALPSTNNEDKDFNPPLYELLFFKEVPKSKILLLFSFENEGKFSN
nr:reverse transcriptase domain-containing protein [Tanacetum cinerariifolium]